MSDFNNDNSYNYEFSGNQPEEKYSYYSDNTSSTPPQKPKKPVGQTALSIIAAVLCLGIGCAGGIQIYRFTNDNRFKNTADAENSESETSESGFSDVSDDNSDTKETPDPQKLPGLFDIAARSDSKYLPDIVDEIMPSVVGISSTFEIKYKTSSFYPWFGFQSEPTVQEGVATGTGIVMTEDGYICTNAHVVYMSATEEYEAGEAIEVSVLFSNEKEYDAKIVEYDVDSDIAVLKIDETGFTPAEFGNSDELRVGELVIAVGNPLGFELFGSVTSGIVSALNREISINDKNMTLIQTDAAINSGNSGGPLLNSCGQVIGINSAKMSSSYGTASVEGLGFAIPINDAKTIIDDLINKGYVTGRPQIGISGVNITESYSNYFGLPIGIYVRSIDKGSSAEEAGILAGDVIVGINDEPVTTVAELNNIKNKFKAGDTVTIKVYRNNEEIDLPVILHEATNSKNSENDIEEATEEASRFDIMPR